MKTSATISDLSTMEDEQFLNHCQEYRDGGQHLYLPNNQPARVGRNTMRDEILNNKDVPEYIICAAIHFNDGVEHEQQPYNIPFGFVVAGRRHHNCFATIFHLSGKDTTYKKYKPVQGFLTSKDRFLNRKDAGKLAFERGQIKEESTCLISEELY